MTGRYANLRTPGGESRKDQQRQIGRRLVYITIGDSNAIFLLSSRITTPYVVGKEDPGSPRTPDYALHRPTLKLERRDFVKD